MRWNWIFVLCLSTGVPAMAADHGYRVYARSQTLIQIARDVYKDERLWKEIAYWNGIKPPYALSVGQVLVLKTPPVVTSKHLVTGAEVQTVAPLDRWPSVERKILKSGDGLIYVVNERAPSLMMVARELYGDESMAKKISSWGGFEPEARLSLGQHLRLKVPPTKTAAEGTAILIKNWRALENDLMVKRLGGTVVQERQPAVAMKKSKPKAKPPCVDPCAAPCGGGQVTKAAVGEAAGMALGGGTQGVSASAENRGPQSASTDDQAFVLEKKSDSPDGVPTAHKTENYWLGDEATHLIEVLQKKLNGR